MPESKRRSVALVIVLFVAAAIYGASLIWMAFQIISRGDIGWLDALALHCIALAYVAIYTITDL